MIALVAMAMVFVPPLTSAEVKQVEVDLSKMQTGVPPANFEISRTGKGAPAKWVVVDDPTTSQGRAIAQTSTDRTDYRFPLAVYEPASATDVEVTVRFKPISGKVDQAGGIAVRLTSPDDYYVVRANALENNVRFYRVVKGKREQLAGANVKVASGQWHTLGLKADGDRFTVSFDGKELYTAQDKTFQNEGKIALWTKADSLTHFDEITISKLK
jgi:hypothetical protein